MPKVTPPSAPYDETAGATPGDAAAPVLRAAALAGVAHGFLGREGGVSTGLYLSLNVGLGSGDAAEAVDENRRRAAAAVAPGAFLVTLHQVHSAAAVVVDRPPAGGGRPRADALVTRTPGLALGVLTADCAPVLLADRERGVVAAAHAGWRGAFSGILEATVAAMLDQGARPEAIVAAVGPCIAQASYEVDAAFHRRFVQQEPEHDRFFVPGSGHGRRSDRLLFDLEAYVLARLAAAGVRTVEALGQDTCAQPERFFSFRRATHRGEPDYGRQLALIAL